MTRERARGILFVTTAVLMGMSAVAAGCSSDTAATGSTDAGNTDGTTSADSAADTGTTGSITGTITYSGTATGPAIYVSAGAVFPPSMSQAPLYSQKVTPATFPATYTLANVKPGTYYLSTYLSSGTDHMFGPIPADPKNLASAPQPVTVTAGAPTQHDMQLLDPPNDGGSESGTDSGTDSGSDAADSAG